MSHDYEPDPLLLSLAHLEAVAPRAECDARIRARCHFVLARREAARRRERRASIVARAADVALTAVLCGYAAIAAVEAFRLILLPQ